MTPLSFFGHWVCLQSESQVWCQRNWEGPCLACPTTLRRPCLACPRVVMSQSRKNAPQGRAHHTQSALGMRIVQAQCRSMRLQHLALLQRAVPGTPNCAPRAMACPTDCFINLSTTRSHWSALGYRLFKLNATPTVCTVARGRAWHARLRSSDPAWHAPRILSWSSSTTRSKRPCLARRP